MTSLRKMTFAAVVATALMIGGVAMAATTINSFPDTSQTTTFTADVSEQARVTVPSGVTFSVTDTNSATVSNATVTIDSIAMELDHYLKVSLQANAATFTSPGGSGTEVYECGDVSWAATGWTGGTGALGTLLSTAYSEIVSCTAGSNTCSNSGALAFTLAADNTMDTAGNHTLVATWKFEVIDPV